MPLQIRPSTGSEWPTNHNSNCWPSDAFCRSSARRRSARSTTTSTRTCSSSSRPTRPRATRSSTPELLTNIAAGLFILPFVLFSGMAGQLADRYDKALVLKVVKAAEIAIMAIAALGFATHSIEVLLGALFLMGVHSTFFAPAKYGMLPEVLHDTELVGGNALVEMGTFVAILLGTLVGRAAGGRRQHRRDLSGADRRSPCAGFVDQPVDPDAAVLRRRTLQDRLATRGPRRGTTSRAAARIARRVPVDPRHLVVLVLRRAGARAAAAVTRRTCSAAASRS